MAKALSAGHFDLGIIVLPSMCYNQFQIIVGAFVARRYARHMHAGSPAETEAAQGA